jgi:luciferase-like monooxygenase
MADMDVITDLPQRRGVRPTTTSSFPHSQLDQQPDDPRVHDDLIRRAFALDGVLERESLISVPGARALFLDDDVPAGPDAAFMRGREFAHFHPAPDWSLHVALPDATADLAIECGWAELHLIARTEQLPGSVVMVYAPRDSAEAETVLTLLRAARNFAARVE